MAIIGKKSIHIVGLPSKVPMGSFMHPTPTAYCNQEKPSKIARLGIVSATEDRKAAIFDIMMEIIRQNRTLPFGSIGTSLDDSNSRNYYATAPAIQYLLQYTSQKPDDIIGALHYVEGPFYTKTENLPIEEQPTTYGRAWSDEKAKVIGYESIALEDLEEAFGKQLDRLSHPRKHSRALADITAYQMAGFLPLETFATV